MLPICKPLTSFILLLVFQLPFAAHAQPKQPQVGDKFDYTFTNLINYKTKTAKVSDFKGKLLILDYWATSCGSCIASWPKLLELQEKFKDQIQILLVNTHQDETTVRKAIERQKRVNKVNMTLPSVCYDTTLYNLMPYWGVPHVVWIDQRGYLRSVTGGDKLNESVINSILNKEEISLQQKTNHVDIAIYKSESKIKDVFSPLFVNGNCEDGNNVPMLAQTVLTSRILGQTPASILNRRSNNYYTLTMVNTTIENLYRVAYTDWNFRESHYKSENLDEIKSNRVIWTTPQEEYRIKNSKGEYNERLVYTYQLTTAPTTKKRMQEMMKLDLLKYFGLDARIEKRTVKCLVLSATDTAMMRYKGTEKFPVLNTKTNRTIWNNTTIEGRSGLIWRLDYGQYFNSPYPIVDETNYKGKVGSFEIYDDHQLFDKELKKFGMRFTLQDREVDILVIDQTKNMTLPVELEPKTDTTIMQWIYN